MDIKFEFAQKSDLPKIVEIYNQTIKLKTVTADTQPVTVADRKTWFEEYNQNSYPLWTIKKDNVIIGWVGLEPFYGRAAYSQTAEISLYIDENYRGHHLGTKALDFVKSQLKYLGVKNIVAFIFKQNSASLALFEKQNFKRWGFLPQVAQIDNNYLDLVIMGQHFVTG